MTSHDDTEHAAQAQQQDTHHYILTAQKYGELTTLSGTVSPLPGATRYHVFRELLAKLARDAPQFAHAAVLHFSLEPNQL